MSSGSDHNGADRPKPGTAAARRSGNRPPPARPVDRTRRSATPPKSNPPDSASDTSGDPPASATGPPARVRRDESTEFLLQSLRDLDAERAAGDLDDDDYQALRDDYTARAAAALRAEQKGKAPPVPGRQRRSPLQWAMIVAGVAGFAVLAGVLMAQASGDRRTGDGITGEVTNSPTQAASRCIQMSAAANPTPDDTQATLECYRAVIEDDPDNAVARTYLGWTLHLTAQRLAAGVEPEALVGLYTEAGRQLDLAVEADPGYADARAFQVVLAVNEGSYELAAEHLAVFDSLDVPADMANLIDSMRPRIDAGLAEADGSDGSDGSDGDSTAGNNSGGASPTTEPG